MNKLSFRNSVEINVRLVSAEIEKEFFPEYFFEGLFPANSSIGDIEDYVNNFSSALFEYCPPYNARWAVIQRRGRRYYTLLHVYLR